MRTLSLLAIVIFPAGLAAGRTQPPSDVLPPAATMQLSASLEAAFAHTRHVWRDTAPWGNRGTVNAYVEIARGDRRKWEFDMRANARAIDRMIPDDIGGYPVNYGFVPQTVSYDGDPFDALVLGPPLPGGTLVPGAIVGLMYMEDEKGSDAKVVVSPLGRDGRALYQLTAGDRQEIANYFRTYKRREPGKFSNVPGWGSVEDGLAHIVVTHAFFRQCRLPPGSPCRISR